MNRGLSKLDPSRYHHFRDLDVPHPPGTGTTLIDHAVVSTARNFLVETKNFRGPNSSTGRKIRFQNPIHQNKLYVAAISRLLGLPEGTFRPVVSFIGTQMKSSPRNPFQKPLPSWTISTGQPILG